MTEAQVSSWDRFGETFYKIMGELEKNQKQYQYKKELVKTSTATTLTPEQENLKIRFRDEDGDEGTIYIPNLTALLENLDEFVVYDFEEDGDEDDAKPTTTTTCSCKQCACRGLSTEPNLEPNLEPKPKPKMLIVDEDGFLLSYVPEHPDASSTGYYPTHRLVLESYLRDKNQYTYLVKHPTKAPGKWYLDPDTPVVFLDGDKKNIQVSNLAIIPEELSDEDIIERLVKLNRIVVD